MRIYTYYFTAIMLIAYSFIFYTELIRRDLIRRLAPTMAGATRRLHLDMNRTFLALVSLKLLLIRHYFNQLSYLIFRQFLQL